MAALISVPNSAKAPFFLISLPAFGILQQQQNRKQALMRRRQRISPSYTAAGKTIWCGQDGKQ
jgi:hypothetical protein